MGNLIKTNGENLVFVVGCPRSGTTFLQSLLTTQESIISFPETHFFSIITRKILKDNNLTSVDFTKIDALIQEYIPNYLSEEDLLQIQASTLKECFENLLEVLLKKQKVEKKFSLILEKTPEHYFVLDRIKTLYPKSKIIFIVRNPFDVILSRKMKIPSNKEFSIQELTQAWKKMTGILEASKTSIGQDLHIIKYEDLLSKREETLSGVVSFLNFSLDISKINNYNEEAKNLILPFETWKKDVESGNLGEKGICYTNRELFYIHRILEKQMSGYGYESKLKGFNYFKELIKHYARIFQGNNVLEF